MEKNKCCCGFYDFTFGYPTIQCRRCKNKLPLLTKYQLDTMAKNDINECHIILREIRAS